MLPSQGRGPEFDPLYPHHYQRWGIIKYMDKTYANRGRLRIPQRSALRPMVINSAIIPQQSDLPSVQPESELSVIETPPLPMPLPTIPIMKYVSVKPVEVDPPQNVISKNKRKLMDDFVKSKQNDDVLDEEVTEAQVTDQIIREFDSEPATIPTTNSADDKKHKIVRHNKPVLRQVPLAIVILAILGTTGYVSYDSWQTNNQIKAALKSKTSSSVLGAINENQITNQQQPAPAQVDIQSNNDTSFLNGYEVAADSPKAIFINKIGVAARIVPMGVNDDLTLQAPESAYDVGWYSGSSKPGQDGAVLLDGHTSASTAINAVFDNLGQLTTGDLVIIQMGDNSQLSYRVVFIEKVPLENIDMNKAINTYNGVKQGLNIITCTGTWIENQNTLDHRLIVYTEPV